MVQSQKLNSANSIINHELPLHGSLILAPLAGVSDYPMRVLARRLGADLVFTEMISSEAVIRRHKRTLEMMPLPSEQGSVIVQLFGARPESLAEATMVAEQQGAAAVDLNMGCPVKKVVTSGAGAALMQEPERVRAVLRAMRSATSLPLTIKMRSGWERHDPELILQLSQIALEEGCQAVTLHPRSRSGQFKGKADWGLIGYLVENTQLPVIASGDIISGSAARDVIEQTGCAAVMVGRAAMGNPWIFSEILAFLKNEEYAFPSLQRRTEVALEHLDLCVEFYGAERAVKIMRKHLLWYFKGFPGARSLRATLGELNCVKKMQNEVKRLAFEVEM